MKQARSSPWQCRKKFFKQKRFILLLPITFVWTLFPHLHYSKNQSGKTENICPNYPFFQNMEQKPRGFLVFSKCSTIYPVTPVEIFSIFFLTKKYTLPSKWSIWRLNRHFKFWKPYIIKMYKYIFLITVVTSRPLFLPPPPPPARDIKCFVVGSFASPLSQKILLRFVKL